MEKIPLHIAIIMDGNGRWAQARGLPRIQGHRVGSRNVRKIVTYASKRGIRFLTLYAFSAENWQRPEREVRLLMMLLKIYAVRERKTFMENDICLRVIGELNRIPQWARQELEKTIELTRNNRGMTLQLALSYGGRQEIVQAAQHLATEVQTRRLSPEQITEEAFSKHLTTAESPDPDLVIRTSGEQRISNFLLWQSAYAEFYFSNCLWPDFDEKEFESAIQEFQCRERRFGGLSSQILTKSSS